MGLYDNLNRIQRAIEKNQTDKQAELKASKQEQLIKHNLLSLLQNEILEAEAEGFDLYALPTKDRLIQNVLNVAKRNYKEDRLLINKDFSRYFLIDNYYKTIKTLQKNTPKSKLTYKEELQNKKLELQIEAMQQKAHQQTIQQTQLLQEQKAQNTQAIFKYLVYLIIIPIAIIGGFFVECAKEASRSGRRRR